MADDLEIITQISSMIHLDFFFELYIEFLGKCDINLCTNNSNLCFFFSKKLIMESIFPDVNPSKRAFEDPSGGYVLVEDLEGLQIGPPRKKEKLQPLLRQRLWLHQCPASLRKTVLMRAS